MSNLFSLFNLTGDLKNKIQGLDCPAGSYQDRIGLAYCVGCIPGQFQNEKGKRSCIKCASGRKFYASIATTRMGSRARTRGRVGISASNCVACDKGQYQLEEGSTFCLPCLIGTFQNMTGSSSCNDCPIGFSNGETEKESCTLCKEGRFQDAIKEADCKECPAGLYSTEIGAVSDNVCIGCPPGTYSSATGLTSPDKCINCAAGKRNPNNGSNSSAACDDCGVNTKAAEEGSSKCTSCGVGEESLKGSLKCTKCDAGEAGTGKNGACESCPSGQYRSSQMNASACSLCPVGWGSSGGSTKCQTCDKGKFSVNEGSDCKNCPEKTFQDQSASTSCIACPTGWQQPNKGSSACISLNWKTPSSCKDTEYLNNTAMAASLWECQPCPKGGDCSGPIVATNIRPKFGWWKIPLEERAATFTDSFAECFYPPACPGALDQNSKEFTIAVAVATAPLNSTNATCSVQLGFRSTSRLCQSCAPGHSRTTQSSCVPCSTSKEDNGTTAIVAFAVLGIFILFVVLNVLRMRSFRIFDAERRRKSLHSTIKRIILSHLQMVSIVLGLSVPWPQLLKIVLNAVSSVASFSEGINSFECLYQDIDHSDFYNGVLVFTAVGPLLFVGGIAIYWFGLVHCFGPLKCGSQIQSGVGAGPKTSGPTTNTKGSKGSKGTEKKATTKETKTIETKTIETKTTTTTTTTKTTKTTKTTAKRITYTNADAFISSSVFFCFFAVPSIVAIGTTALRCYDVGGKSFVYIDLEKECYQGQHLFVSLLVAWPMILFYGALLPGCAMLLLRRAGAARSTDPHLMLRWGMLHSGYRSSKFWWELVVLLRKYSIIMLVAFNSKGEYQLHMALGIFIVALHQHDSQRPFGHRHVNPANAVLHRYEMGSLLTLLVMLWCGGFFSLNFCQTQNGGLGWCEFMVVVVLVCNFLLVAVLVTKFVKACCHRNHLDEQLIRMIEKKQVKEKLIRWRGSVIALVDRRSRKTTLPLVVEMTEKKQVNTKQSTHRRLLTNEGVEYFEDVENRTTSWTLPPNGVVAVDASAAGSRHYRLETEDGVEYFVDVDRRTASWVLPDNGIVVKANDVKMNGVNPMMYHNKKRSLSEIAKQIDVQKTHRRLLTNEGVEYFEDVENRTTSWTLPPNGVVAAEASNNRH